MRTLLERARGGGVVVTGCREFFSSGTSTRWRTMKVTTQGHQSYTNKVTLIAVLLYRTLHQHSIHFCMVRLIPLQIQFEFQRKVFHAMLTRCIKNYFQ